jgi:glycosyltransferase involved in cell wall biosynthesis
VSIGLPVFNGERYLAEALESLLKQTYSDFEIIISDNASSDATPQICQAYVERDSRITYHRNVENLGGAENFNHVFRISKGGYFKWMSHDDLCGPEFIERCVAALDREPAVAVCYPGQIFVDERGKFLKRKPYGLNTALIEPDQRFRAVILLRRARPAIFGLIRRSVLAETRLLGKYVGSDHILLAELALRGRFFEVDGDLHLSREHPMRSVYAYPTRFGRTGWFDPASAGKMVFPAWRHLREYGVAVSRAPLDRQERIRCRLYLIEWMFSKQRRLREDLLVAGREFGKWVAGPRRFGPTGR